MPACDTADTDLADIDHITRCIFPNTDAGTMVGKPLTAMAVAADAFADVARNVLRETEEGFSFFIWQLCRVF